MMDKAGLVLEELFRLHRRQAELVEWLHANHRLGQGEIPEFLSKRRGDRAVFSRDHDFVTLSDVSGEAESRPGFPPSAQDGGEAGARPEEGSSECGAGRVDAHCPCEDDQSVTVSGAEEGATIPTDSAPEPDLEVSPEEPATELPASSSSGKGEEPSSSPVQGVSSQTGASSSSGVEAPFSEMADKALNIYAGQAMSAREIAIEVGSSKTTVLKWIRQARSRGDSRAAKGDSIRTSLPLRPTSIIKKVMTGESRPKKVAVEKPEPAAEPLANLIPIGPIAIDDPACAIVGPKGVWHPHRPCLRILTRLARLKPGQLLDVRALAHDTMSSARIIDSLPLWTTKLAEIGITLGRMGDNLYLKVD